MRNALLWGTASLLVLLSLLLLCLLLLPRAVSSSWFKTRLERRLSGTLHREVTIGELSWSWSDGILVQGISLADDPRFSKGSLLSIRRIRLVPEFRELLNRRLALALEVEGMQVHLIRNPKGETNLASLLRDLTEARKRPQKEAPSAKKTFPLLLPGDLRLRLRVPQALVQVDDRLQGSTLRLRNIHVNLDMPSLLTRPILLALSLEEVRNESPPIPAELQLTIKGLGTPERTLDPARASIDMEGKAAGLRFTARADPRTGRYGCRFHIALTRLTETLRPFLPPAFPLISGTVKGKIEATGAPGKTFSFRSTVSGKEIAPLGEKTEGAAGVPVSFAFSQKGEWIAPENRIQLQGGELRIQEHTRLSWHGGVKLPGPGSPLHVDMTLGPAALDLPELRAAAESFLPRGLPVPPRAKPLLKGLVRIGSCRVQGPLLQGTVRIQLDNWTVKLPNPRFQWPGGNATAGTASLVMDRGEAALTAFHPSRARIRGRFGCQDLKVSGNRPVRLSRLQVPDLELRADHLAPAPGSLLGVSGTLALRLSALLQGLEGPADVRIAETRSSLALKCTLEPGPWAAIRVRRADFTVPSIQSSSPSMAGVRLATRWTTRNARIRVQARPWRVDLEHASFQWEVDPFLRLRLEAEARDLGFQRLLARGGLSLDLARIPASLHAAALPNLDLERGRVDLTWDLQGRIPEAAVRDRFRKPGIRLLESLQKGNFLNTFDLSCTIQDVDLRYRTSGKHKVHLGGVHTSQPLRIRMGRNFRTSSLSLALGIKRVLELPSTGPIRRPFATNLALEAKQEELRSFSLSESLRADLFDLDQSVRLTLNNIGRIFRDNTVSPLYVLAHEGEGRLTSSFHIRMDSEPEALAPFHATGGIDSKAVLTLEGGRRLDIHYRLESPRIDGGLENKLQVSNLRVHLDLERRFALRERPPSRSGGSPGLLSEEVLTPPRQRPGESSAPIRSGAWTGTRPTLSFDTLRLAHGPLSLVLSHHEMGFRLVKGLPQVDPFQFDLLGGSVVGSASVVRAGSRPVFRLTCAFTDLNTGLLLSKGGKGKPSREAELSGRLVAELPLEGDRNRVVQHLYLDLDLNRIGSKALDRFLYALDPYETNEAVVHQRKLLRVGVPRRVRIRIRDGGLFLTGSVDIQGVPVEFPRIERFNVSNLPQLHRLDSILPIFSRVGGMLSRFGADTIYVDRTGTVRFQPPDS